MWNQEAMNSAVKTPAVQLSATAVAAATVSAAVTYVVVNKRAQRRADLQIEEQIEATKAYYEETYKVGVFSDPVMMAESLSEPEVMPAEASDPAEVFRQGRDELAEKIEGLDYRSKTKYRKGPEALVEEVEQASQAVDEVMDKAVETVKNVFKESVPVETLEFDYDVEVPKRDSDEPYIITYEEYNAGEKEYTTSNLTWYINDGMLADSTNDVVDEIDSVVGDENLQKFGYGSRNNNIVYVRNDRLELDMEILMSDASFIEVIHGIPDPTEESELRHSDRGVRKFRNRE